MKYLFFIIFSLIVASALLVHGKDNTDSIKRPYEVVLDSSNNTFNVTKYEVSEDELSNNYTLPYVELTKNQAIDDSLKWFPTMLDVFDMLDSLSHDKDSEMFIWLFYRKNNYDQFMIDNLEFDITGRAYKDKIHGGFILNGKAFIIIFIETLRGGPLKHRKEIENMFVKRSDSIRINFVQEYAPNVHRLKRESSTVTGVYQDYSLLVPYRYIQDSKQIYFLNDSVSKYYETQ
ncbi:MAG: hypothetical protein K2M68_02665 [Muribaculaceae bacterium]|nr:hypothetical protein [Muribaculaceae bacterium]